jgi:hypothetical protein
VKQALCQRYGCESALPNEKWYTHAAMRHEGVLVQRWAFGAMKKYG